MPAERKTVQLKFSKTLLNSKLLKLHFQTKAFLVAVY